MRRYPLSSPVRSLALGGAVAVSLAATSAQAVDSAELIKSAAHQYGRFEARVKFAAGDGVISSFFLWKDGSEKPGIFWNELDFEKLRAGCELELNALYGMPEKVHVTVAETEADLCNEFHTYAYEWTPEYIAWFLDGVEIRREVGEAATAFSENTDLGMQFRFNIWPGTFDFGGVFDPAILPVRQYIDWVQYSAYAAGDFQLEWREDFDATTLPAGWTTGSWKSPKNLSTHRRANVTFEDGHAVLALTEEPPAPAPGPVAPAPSSSAGAATAVPSAMTGATEDGDGGGCGVVRAGFSPTGARGGWSLWTLAVGLSLAGWRRARRHARG